jgi:hypothetical protein
MHGKLKENGFLELRKMEQFKPDYNFNYTYLSCLTKG